MAQLEREQIKFFSSEGHPERAIASEGSGVVEILRPFWPQDDMRHSRYGEGGEALPDRQGRSHYFLRTTDNLRRRT